MEENNFSLSVLGTQLKRILREVVEDAVEEALKRNEEQRTLYPERVTVDQASKITGYSKNSLYQMHSKGTIPGALKVGGKLLFDRDTLKEWVENGGRTY